jgi:hypothetical protein
MPSAQTVIWSAAVFLIVTMLGIIGYLIKNGFISLKADLKAELRKLWEKLDKHQTLAEANAASIQEFKAVAAERTLACAERHRLIELELAHLRHRKEDGNENA